VSGRVTLAKSLAAQAGPSDTLFVFARPADGSRMPLALLRAQVKDLPLEFSLDDSLAMNPAARISGAKQVVIGARISKSGQAMPQPGDLQGFSAPVAVGARGVAVEITETVGKP
jgi:cytochrome c-type biogenesis protein CcmH